MFLLEWWNLIFELPIILAIILTLLFLSGTLATDDDIDIEIEGDTESGGGTPNPLTFLGIGKIPFSILITTFCLLWGFVGFVSNQMLITFIPSPEIFFWISLVLATIIAVFITRYVAIGFAKLLPSVSTYTPSRQDFLGKTGETRYQITETFGAVLVHDRFGNLHELNCRVLPGEEPIPPGKRVALYEYDPERSAYFAIPEDRITN